VSSSPITPPPGAPPPARRVRQWIYRIVKVALVLLAVGLAGRQLWVNWEAVREYDWQINFGWLGLSVAAHLFTLLLFSIVWCRLILGFGHRLKIRYSFKLAYIATFGRYIPGRIWPLLAMAYLARRLGIPEQHSLTSWGLALIFTLTAAFAVTAAGIGLVPSQVGLVFQGYLGAGVWAAGVVLALASLALIYFPDRTLVVFNFLLRLIGRKPLRFRLRPAIAFQVLGGYAACWISYGVSFWLFLKAVMGATPVPIVSAITIFVIAYQMGYLAVFSPGGIGVRELALIGLLHPFLGPISAAVAVAARLWNMVVEIIAVIIAWRVPMPAENSERDLTGLPPEPPA